MLQEAEILNRLSHDHVLKFCGLSFIDGVQIVTPLRDGTLKDYLINPKNKISSRKLLLYCEQISQVIPQYDRKRKKGIKEEKT